ncbi:MAG: CHASE domain-containing protein [Colwellia sp.]
MKQSHLIRFFISAILYLAFCLLATWLINPQSIVNFIGPSAALISGLLLIWGSTPLIAVLLVSPILAFILNYYFHFNASFAVMTIAVLTTILQGIWTKQLVFLFIQDKKWLTSRRHLFSFILRIGPIASLVSASSALVISMLDNQVMAGTFFYTFINTWAASMLVAVFFIPLLLMIKGSKQLTLTKRLFVGFTTVLGGMAIFLLLKTSQYEQQQYREALFNQSKEEVERLVLDEIDIMVNKVNSLSAFFKASDDVTFSEFNLFSESFFKHDSSMRALEWAPVVPFKQRKEFERKSSIILQNDFKIKERLADGQLVVAASRNKYVPLYYIYPQQGNQEALGLDVYQNLKETLAMKNLVDREVIVASAPFVLVQDEFTNPGILFSKAVFSPPKNSELTQGVERRKLSLINKDKLMGFVVGVVQFDRFFDRLAKEKSLEISFFIQDVSGHEAFPLFGQALPTANRHVDTITLSVFSRLWQIEVVEKKSWFSQSKSWQAWAVLIGVTFGGVLFQILMLMMTVYSNELVQQVNTKTRALILAKESSEQKSIAKSQFLQILNTELRVPLLAIKSFVEQLKKKGIQNKEVNGINHAGSNVALLLDSMLDLSNIESGKIIPKAECFDFYGFLLSTESVLKASHAYDGKSLCFIIDEGVPHYINSDELYIQKLLHALIESAHHVLKADMLRLSIKLHQHKRTEASLFFTLSSQNPIIEANVKRGSQPGPEHLVADSTALSMAIKYSQLLGGDTNLGILSSGEGVLNASIRVTTSSSEQQEIKQGLTFD